MTYGINYGFYKENIKFMSLSSFVVLNDSFGVKTLHLLNLLMKYKKWGEY